MSEAPGLDDNEDAVVVAVAEPVEGHRARAFSSNAWERTMQAALLMRPAGQFYAELLGLGSLDSYRHPASRWSHLHRRCFSRCFPLHPGTATRNRQCFLGG